MITFHEKGDFSKLAKYLNKMKDAIDKHVIAKYAQEGVNALSAATPVDSGATASSWSYEIEHTKDSIKITYSNSNVQDGVPIAIILQYGHGTGTGDWVQGRDYINPAIQPVFDKIAEAAWKEVTKL